MEYLCWHSAYSGVNCGSRPASGCIVDKTVIDRVISSVTTKADDNFGYVFLWIKLYFFLGLVIVVTWIS